MSKRILFFGGTFDPVHHGHLIVARALVEQHGYDRVTFVPAASPPHKSPPEAPAADREAMLELAARGEQAFEICRLELERDEPSYTYDTLCELRRQHGQGVELNWLIGADMLEELPTWHRASEVLALARIVVACRPPWHQRLAQIISGLRGKLPDRELQDITQSVLTTPLIDISSSDIRRRVRAGMSIRFLTAEKVITYIKKRGLYVA